VAAIRQSGLQKYSAFCRTGTRSNSAKIAKTAHKNGTTLREEALKTGLITAVEFDANLRPEDLIHPK
jgi:fumarate hydratase, class II